MELCEHDLSLSGNDLLHIIDFLDMSICLHKYSYYYLKLPTGW